jgi:hypothetical protein
MFSHRNSVAFFHEHLGAFRRISDPGSIKFECTGIRAKQHKNRAEKYSCNPVRSRHSVLPLWRSNFECNGDLSLHQAATPRSIRPIQAEPFRLLDWGGNQVAAQGSSAIVSAQQRGRHRQSPRQRYCWNADQSRYITFASIWPGDSAISEISLTPQPPSGRGGRL